jgi:protein SCO1/2
MNKLTLIFASVAAVAVLVGGVVYLALPHQAGESGIVNEGAEPPIGPIGAPFHVVDQRGQAVSFDDLRGHPSVIFFGYTSCPDVCPMTLSRMTRWWRALGRDGDRLRVYFVSVDPERDTQAQLATYLSAFDPRIVGLTGTRAQIDDVIAGFHVFTQKNPSPTGGYSMDHTAGLFLLDRDRNLVKIVDYDAKDDVAVPALQKLVAG